MDPLWGRSGHRCRRKDDRARFQMDPLWGRSPASRASINRRVEFQMDPLWGRSPQSELPETFEVSFQMDPLWGRSTSTPFGAGIPTSFRWTPCGVEVTSRASGATTGRVSDGPLVGSKCQRRRRQLDQRDRFRWTPCGVEVAVPVVVMSLAKRFRWTPCGVEVPPSHGSGFGSQGFQMDPLWGRSDAGRVRPPCEGAFQMDPLWGRSCVPAGAGSLDRSRFRWTPCGVEALQRPDCRCLYTGFRWTPCGVEADTARPPPR